MLIPLSKIQLPITRAVKADFFYASETGEKVTEQITINYFSLTVEADLERIKAEKPEYTVKNGQILYSDFCSSRVQSINEFVNDDGTPLELTKKIFQSMHLDNVRSIYEAIMGDIYPKSIPSPSPDGLKLEDEKEVPATSQKKKS